MLPNDLQFGCAQILRHLAWKAGFQRRHAVVFVLLMLAGVLASFELPRNTAKFVVWNLVAVAPLVIPGILLAAWVTASGAGSRTASILRGRMHCAILAASVVGAVTPVCGVTVLPLMAALLGSGVPLAPVMAFWLSSPITDPAMLATTAATLGTDFAIGKTVAAFSLGVVGGLSTLMFANRDWAVKPLRDNLLVRQLARKSDCSPDDFDARIWQDSRRKAAFEQELVGTARLVILCLVPAFAAEHLLGLAMEPDALAGIVGSESSWAIPLAVFVGAPVYLDGFAALPLARGLMDHGMSPGAAMAFLVSGGVVSIWGAIAIFPVLRGRPFLLYLVLAIVGSMIVGWSYEVVGN